MNKKVLGIAVFLLAVAMLATPLVSAKPWEYPKNNAKFEKFAVTFGFNWTGFIMAEYAATAGLEDAEKVVVTCPETVTLYQITIGDDGAGQRVYTLGEDFTYSGQMTFTVFDPVLPYAFNPNNILGTLFIGGRMQHFRVDYVYDFSAVPGGLDGTITMIALVTGNGLVLSGDHPMFITSIKGTGDFQNVQIKATAVPPNHMGVVSGWPE
jgi:hypothetical protein